MAQDCKMSATHPRKPSNMVAERHDLCDEVECLKGDLAETKTSLTADETLAAMLAENWDNQSSENDQRWNSRVEEILAIHETINLLNDDDALEHFKATLLSPSWVQVHQSTAAVGRRAMYELRGSSRTRSNFVSNLKLISLVLSGKSADFSKVISMIDEVVTLLKAEQGEDDGKKGHCAESFGQTEDEAKVLGHQVSGHRDATAEYKDQLSNTDARIERTVEETIDVPTPQVMKETVEDVKLNPQEKVQNCTLEQTGEVIQLIPQGRIPPHDIDIVRGWMA